MLQSTRLKINYPDPLRTDSADVPRDFGSIVAWLDGNAMGYGQGTSAARPTSTPGTPGQQGRIYVATDVTPHLLYYDYGIGWDPLGSISAGSVRGSTSGNVQQEILQGSLRVIDIAPAALTQLGSGHMIGEMLADWPSFILPLNSFETWAWADGSAISRVTYLTLMNQICPQLAAVTTNGSTSVTGLASTLGLAVGTKIEGVGITAGATVATVVSASAITISIAATATGTPTLRFFPHGNGDGSSTFNLPDPRGRSIVTFGTHANVLGVGMTDGIAAANRSGLRHRHTPHVHDENVRAVTNNLTTGATTINMMDNLGGGYSTLSKDGGSGIAADPLDGGNFIVMGAPIRLL